MSTQDASITYLLYRCDGRRNEPGYFFGTARPGDTNYTDEELLFVYFTDIDQLLPIIEKQYPLTDPKTGEVYDRFDHCWDNPIAAPVWQQILEEMQHFPAENEDHRAFIDLFVEWVRERLQHADEIIVEGTL
ncbi:hypothetical protein [Paenibacillus bovis]|uniref:Uncharacterized protein n=1 Tax=Paenibacillus bovis TaxID=1616788 RepID=A0A172ZLJ8_9BACL|nr:hypothetical protein [Paenibacillus bovis]ANF98419.1 hypothetical protein AR543_22120 [Paenibacillus bovis]